MTGAIFIQYKQVEKWKNFEEDLKEFILNKKQYKGISQRPETYTFYYSVKGKQIKSFNRLSDIYDFKLKFEAKNG